MNPSPKIITGSLHSNNRAACDWGYQGLLAYGCHQFVVVVDPKTLQIIQTVGPHKANVAHVRWSGENYQHAFATGSTYNLQLASADTNGCITVWDVTSGAARTEFSNSPSSKQVIAMEWYSGYDMSHDLLMILRVADIMELWDAYSGVRLWKKGFGFPLLSFTLNPFDITNAAVLCESPHILIISDINVTTAPSDNYKTIQFIDPQPASTQGSSPRRTISGTGMLRASKSWSKVVSLASNIQSGIRGSSEGNFNRPSSPDDAADYQNSCLQIVFNPAHRHNIFLVFEREIQILDLDLDLTVGAIRLDKSSPAFMKMYACRWLDILFCLHDNGSVSVRAKRKGSAGTPTDSLIDYPTPEPMQISMEMTYDLRCQSDPLRLMRQCKVFTFVHQPVTEKTVALLLSDSRIVFWDVMATNSKLQESSNENNSSTLADMVGCSIILPPSSHRALKRNRGITLRMVATGLVSGVISPVTVMAVRPSAADDSEAGVHVAVGSSLGTIQLVNVHSGQVENEYKLFMSPVRDLEWISHTRILTYSSTEPGPYGSRAVKSEILLLHTSSGHVSTVRGGRDKDGLILCIKCSPSRLFFVILFKDKPLEIWNLRARQFVREIPLPVDKATTFTWYPLVTWTLSKKKVTEERSGKVVEVDKRVTAEQFFLAAQHDTGVLMRISLLDSIVSDLTYFTNEVVFGVQNLKIEIVCLAWRGKFLVMGDKSGQLYLSDARNKGAPAKRIYERPGYRPRSIKFAPGRHNLKFLVLYEDGVDSWDIINDKAEIVNSSPSVTSSVIDACWVGPESFVLATGEGCLHVFDMSQRLPRSPEHHIDDGFVHISAPLIKWQTTKASDWNLKEPVFVPGMLDPRTSFLLKYTLQCGLLQKHADSLDSIVRQQLDLIESAMYKHIIQPTTSTAERCYTVARLFGDECDMVFWRLALYQMQTGKPDTNNLRRASQEANPVNISHWLILLTASAAQEVSDLVDLGLTSDDLQMTLDGNDCNDTDLGSKGSAANTVVKPLEPTFDVLLDENNYKMYQSARLTLHNRKRCSYREKRVCASRYIMLDKMDMAVQVLMETDQENDNFLNDCLKACLVSSIHSSSSSLSTIKLAATHLIAAGKLSDGIELLCLIDKRLDACKYYMSYRRWDDAVFLAKTSLPYGECIEVMCKWSEYLWQNNEKNKAVLVMLSLGQYTTVLLMLCAMNQYDRGALFLQACLDGRLLEKNNQTENYIESIFVEFATLLTVTGYKAAVQHYCGLAGSKGHILLSELQNSSLWKN